MYLEEDRTSFIGHKHSGNGCIEIVDELYENRIDDL